MNKSPSTPASPLEPVDTDPLLSRRVVEPEKDVVDPIAEALERLWRPLLTVVACVTIAWWGKQMFDRTRENSMKSASEVFARVRLDFGSLESVAADLTKARAELVAAQKNLATPAAPPAKGGTPASPTIDERQKAVDAAQKKLTETESRFTEIKAGFDQRLQALARTKPPYVELSRLYQIAGARLAGGDLAGATESEALQFASISAEDPKRIIAELKALAIARGMLDTAAQEEQGLKLLREIASSGQYVQVAAAVAVAQLAQDAEARGLALDLLEKVAREHPEQAELLQPEISRLQSDT